MSSVKGYLGPVDALAISSVLIEQTKRGYAGGVAEIGVFYGRSFFLMAKLLAAGEKALAADLFDIDASASCEKSGQLRKFLENAAILGVPVDERDVFVGPSGALSPLQITVRAGPIRFFSVDGGHELHHVIEDGDLARNTLAPHGVICFDDFCNPEWSEVTLGVFDFLRKHKDFLPFAITEKKAYVCRRGYEGFYREAVLGSELLASFPKSVTRMLGHEPIFVSHPMLPQRLPYELLSRFGLGRLSERLYL